MASEAFELAVRMGPGETECLFDIIYCHAKMRSYEKALTIAHKLRELEPGNERVVRFMDMLRVSIERQGQQ